MRNLLKIEDKGRMGLLIIALILSMSSSLFSAQSAQAQWRMGQIGGFALVVQNSPTYAYGSLDSDVNGSVYEGELVYINGWQIGVYHIGRNRWVSDSAVQPIINAAGDPIVDYISRQGNAYYVNDQPLTLPAKMPSQADQFLASPSINAPIVYPYSTVPTDYAGELVDTSAVWYSAREPVIATMRVTDIYSFIYLRTEPAFDAPLATYNAYLGEVLTAYEVVDNWYRIAPNIWAPSRAGDEVLMVPEYVEGYAAPEYHEGGKWISIDLNRQRLTAWEGNDVVVSSPVKSGKFGYHTPSGSYSIYEKVANERMTGSDYDLLDVAWTQYFTSSRIAIHTAYWHHNYNGRPGSHGCVNTPEDKARALFMWSPVGTTVVAHNPYVFDAQDIADADKWLVYER